MKPYYAPTDDISYVPLEPAEEIALFTAFYAGDTNARNELLSRHLKLAAKLALTVSHGLLAEADAISAGNFGLIKALESRRFDPARGFRFSTYCRQYIVGEVRAALRFQGSMTRRFDGHRPSLPTGAAMTGALPQPEDFDHGVNHLDLANSLVETTVEHRYESKELEERREKLIADILGTLPPLEADAVRGEFFHLHSFAETARQHGVTREGVRKAFVRGYRKLAEALAAAGVRKEDVL